MSKHVPGVVCYLKGITSFPALNGRFVTLVEQTFDGDLYYNIINNTYHPLKIINNEKIWRTKSNTILEWGVHNKIHSFEVPFSEKNLIPLEDKDGEDEIITIVGKPTLKEKEYERSSASCN